MRRSQGPAGADASSRPEPAQAGVWDLDSLVTWKGPEMVRLARGLLKDPHQAEDVVQDVLARCVLKWSRIQAVEDPSAYLNRMVVNAVVSHHRRPWRREQVSDPADLPDAPLLDDSAGYGDRQHYLTLLRRLPDAQRATLVLRLYEGLPDAEIANLLHCSQATVRSHAYRGLRNLRRLLDHNTDAAKESR